ncbi:hypothetical protein NDR87_27995 [Nocardia sp. CDC159]|uniref:Uncharacterized protein n=1 Tax=Nocardia pulmonis TaxID=2951408 RepID=A0A9X2EBQ3_9NOCA|nr:MULTISPECIES: hypothetical protein [Nocardia]MCM6777335.1 hypothetical protein [Nocardia pulmonis]MCM6790220.1 hypothetical protein [Nocardia sp. CDC159]
MLTLLIVGVVVVVAVVVIGAYAPSAAERKAFRRASLAIRHSLTDWDAARAPDEANFQKWTGR